jgi:hypothetical protein
VVDRECRKGGFTRHIANAHVPAAAVPADRLRGMDQRVAVLALLDPQHAIGARGPEELVLRVDIWQWTAGNVHLSSSRPARRLAWRDRKARSSR